jgi:hypothetical protein
MSDQVKYSQWELEKQWIDEYFEGVEDERCARSHSEPAIYRTDNER